MKRRNARAQKSPSRKSGYCEICMKLYPSSDLSYHYVQHLHFANAPTHPIRVCRADLDKLIKGEHKHLSYVDHAHHLDSHRHLSYVKP